MPVAHADVDGLGLSGGGEELVEELALQEGPAGERWAFGEWCVAEADLGVAVLELFDDVLRHGAAAGDLVEVGGHLAEDVGRAVGEEKYGGFGGGLHAVSIVYPVCDRFGLRVGSEYVVLRVC